MPAVALTGKRPRRIVAALVSAAALTTAVTACGGSSDSGTAAGSGALPKLTVAFPGATALSMDVYEAQALDMFKKYGVDVQVVQGGISVVQETAAGRIDLVQSGTTSAFAPTQAGHDTSVVYWLAENAANNIAVSANSTITAQPNSDDTLMELSGKKMSVQGAGTSSYGNGQAFSNYIVAHGGKPITLVNLQDESSALPQLQSGQIDAANTTPGYLQEAVDAGKVRYVVKTSDNVSDDVYGGQIAAVALWGLKSNLQGKSEAVSRFLAAVLAAHQLATTKSDAELATDLRKLPSFATANQSSLAAQISFNRPLWSPNNGMIDEDLWNRSLKAFDIWGLNVKPTSGKFAYSTQVDMSYLNNAAKYKVAN